MTDAEFAKHAAKCMGALQRFVYYRLPSRSDGDDVLQETWLAAYENRGKLRDTAGFKAWILRIAANKCNDFFRKQVRRAENPMENDEQLESALANALSHSRYGLNVSEAVQETLAMLTPKDAQLLMLAYIDQRPQAAIAQMLGIPSGTVRSRLYTAKQRFKAAYPYRYYQNAQSASNTKGAINMQKCKLPDTLPEYTIAASEQAPFPVKWEEIKGWFLIPKLGEKLTWTTYDWPSKKRSEVYEMAVIGRASVHGIEGVEITVREHSGGQHEYIQSNRDVTRTFVAQLTDTHCRYLSHSCMVDDIRKIRTFLDGDDFSDWGYGEDNCGNETNLRPKGLITCEGNVLTFADHPFPIDVVGRYNVTIGGKTYDCLCVIDVGSYEPKVLTEQFIDQNGRTVLWRRFNRDDWAIPLYGNQPWSEKLPDNERYTVNGQLFVHWYDCITDYIIS